MHFFKKLKIICFNFFIPKDPKRGLGNVFLRKFQCFYFFHAVKVLQKSKFVTEPPFGRHSRSWFQRADFW
jgi:hypothetical protein